jgi:uncharacterized Zn ribbon protein
LTKKTFETGEWNVGKCLDCGEEYTYGDNAKITAVYCIRCWLKHKQLQGAGA